MTKDDITYGRVAILGVGIEGTAMAKFCIDRAQSVTLLDMASERKLIESSSAENKDELISVLKDNRFEKVFGAKYKDNLSDYDIIIRSPGIKISDQKIVSAVKDGVKISSQIKEFFKLCPCDIIGVTGTKGKGTTSSIIKKMLEIGKQEDSANYRNVYLAGNIGLPAINLLSKLSNQDVVILELSSFQLQDLGFSPHVAVITNIGIDHLDYHSSEEEYRNAKMEIVKNQLHNDYAIINMDSLYSYQYSSSTNAKVLYFSSKNRIDEGAYIRSKNGIDEVVLVTNGSEKIICNNTEVKLFGKHNLENIAASSVVANIYGVSHTGIRKAAMEFNGLPHRLELIIEKNGIKIINDSYATNPAPTIAAIKSFIEPKILILGGSSKRADFSELAKVIAESNTHLVLLVGEEANKINESLIKSAHQRKVIFAPADIEKIVNLALEEAQKGDVILFSPACASFDMFENYKDRGEKFRKAVLKSIKKLP